MTGSAGWLRAGRVGRPHGLDGSFHVVDARPQLLEEGMVLMVDGRSVEVVRRAGSERRLIIRLESCAQRADAEALRGHELLVERTAVPELEPDEWYAEDLEGCRVHDAGVPVGTVRRLLALPSCEVLEVQRPEGGELLVPLVEDAVRAVDVERGEIDIDLRFLGES
jgi:16S rRNA processing protein RimM